MAYQRKTIDTFEILTNYGYGDGWEHECTEFSYRAARETRRVYLENVPGGRVRIRARRDRKSNYTPEQLQAIAAEVKLTRDQWLARRKGSHGKVPTAGVAVANLSGLAGA